MSFDEKLRLILAMRGHRQNWLPEQIRKMGRDTSTSAVSRWTSGQSRPAIEDVAAMAVILRVPIAWFFDPSDTPPPDEDEYAKMNLLMDLIKTHNLTISDTIDRIKASLNVPATASEPGTKERRSVSVSETESRPLELPAKPKTSFKKKKKQG